MQTTVPFGSSLDLAVSSNCSLISLLPRTRKCGERVPGPLQQQLRCGSKLQKPFFVGDCSMNSLPISNSGPSFPLPPPRDPQTRALVGFFVNGRRWGQKDPQNPQNSPNGSNGAVINQSWVQSKGQGLLQKSAWVAAIMLMGGGALYGQGKARAYIERTFLPPVAAMIGQQFGREIQLGKVQRLSPLGITLGPCSVGAHDEEFSCAEIPGVELRVLPIASLRKGQLVVDAVIAEPHILLSQKEDWTWLGIPLVGSEDEKKLVRHSSEPNLDARTKVRRLAREEDGRKGAFERNRAARDAAKRGYKLPGDATKNDAGLKSRGSEKQMRSLGTELEDSDNEEGIDTTSTYLGVDEADGIKAGKHVEERLTEADEANTGFELRNSVLGAKVWIDTNMLRPVKRKVLRRWTKQGLHAISKTVLQRKNLDRSAAAARAYFQKLDGSHTLGSGGRGASGSVGSPVAPSRFVDTQKGSAAPRPIIIEKMEVFGSGDSEGGYRLSPFSETNRSTLPSMSLSSSWSAREDRNEEGKGRPVLPNLKLQVDDSVLCKREIEQVNFRKMNGMRSSLKSLGMRGLERERRGFSSKRPDRKSSGEATNLSTSESSKIEERSSQVTLDSVKEALVQAIRERQENSASVDRKGLRSSNQLSHKAPNSLQEDAVVTELILNEKNPGSREGTERITVGDGKFSVEHLAKEVRTMSNCVSKSSDSAHSNQTGLQKDALVHRTLLEESYDTPYGSETKGGLELDDRGHMEGQQISKKTEQTMETRLLEQTKATTAYQPVALNSVYFKDGTLMLLAYGDREPRVMEKATGQVKFGSSYDQINVRVTGSPKEFRTGNVNGDGGKIFVKVAIDLAKQEWHLKVRGRHLYAPLFEKLLEVPLDWSDGRASGEVHAWMLKDDPFPSFGGRLDVKGLDFAIYDAPAAFKGVSGTLFFQGQRLFFHNTSGLYGAIPLQVSGDMDLNPDDGEYRLSCQVSGVEANSLMRTLKAQPPPFPLAGALKAVVHCRGPLDAPIFEGSAELAGKHRALVYEAPHTVATQAVKENEHNGAVAGYDRIPFASASASFTFNTDDCMAELYGVRAAPVGGGEIRGAGNLWICPEGEVDPSAVNVDCSGKIETDPVLRSYCPVGMDVSSINFGTLHGEAKIRGALMMPVFDIKWDTPEAQGSFDGAYGDVYISREAISLNSSASTYDLSTKIHTLHPPISRPEVRTFEYKPAPPPVVEGLDLDLKLRGFDVMGLAPVSSPMAVSSYMKVTGKVKFNGQVPKPTPQVVPDDINLVNSKNEEELDSIAISNGISELVGEVSLSGLKLNQLLVAPHLTGSLEVSSSRFKIHTTGRTDEHLHVLASKSPLSTSEPSGPDSFFEQVEGASFSLLRGQLRTDFHYQPGHSAKVEIRNLQLDELELASLRGEVQKAELALNFQKRRGQGNLSVKRPRGSGIQGESLDIAARWSGDVITLDKSVLEQENSRYELQGEYVLPSLRDRSVIEKGKHWEKAMGGQLGQMITSMGRWRLRLDVPTAEVSEMLPVARLLSRSSDPAVVSRSKELFLQGVRSAGFSAENLKEQLEYIRRSNGMAAPEGSPESIPLPGLAELRGAWHGTLEASGGGDGDTYAEFDLRGDEWEWGSYKTRKVVAIGDYRNNAGLRLQKFFIQKDTATLHADGTMLGPKPNLHFAVLNFPADLVPPLLHAIQSSTPEPFLSPASRPYSTPIKGILYMEGDLRGTPAKPQCDVQIRLLDGAVGGVSLGKAEMAASLTAANRLAFNAVVEPVSQTGHVRIQGSLPMGPSGLEEHEAEVNGKEREQHMRAGNWGRERSRDRKDEEEDDKEESLETGGEEGWEVRLAESLKTIDAELLESDAVQVDAAVKDGGMMLLTAISPGFQWIQGNADIKLRVRGTVQEPSADGTASFYKVGISSPVLPRPVSNLGGSIAIKSNQLFVEGLEGRVGRRGLVEVKGQLPLRSNDSSTSSDGIEVKAEHLEVRARHVYSGQVNSNLRVMGSLLEPEVTGMIKLSHGEAYLSQEKGTSSSPSTISSSVPGGGYSWMTAASSAGRNDAEIFPLSEQLGGKPPGYKEEQKDDKNLGKLPPIDVILRSLKLHLGPELRMVYPLILNFAVSGELEMNGFADPLRIKPKGTLTFENGDVNLVATQVRLNKDYPNRAKFEPEHGLDPTLDLALIGADWQLKVQGRARNWQDNIVVSSTRTGEQDALSRTEAARVFESQLAESLLEGDGQLAFKKLAAATVDTLMPRIETKGEFGQARWRLVSAPQIPNLLSLDPTTDPFKSLANLSFGAEVEVQFGKHIQASVARRIKESEMATEWTLLYQLNSKMRVLFSSIPSVDNRLLFEFSATSQN